MTDKNRIIIDALCEKVAHLEQDSKAQKDLKAIEAVSILKALGFGFVYVGQGRSMETAIDTCRKTFAGSSSPEQAETMARILRETCDDVSGAGNQGEALPEHDDADPRRSPYLAD